MEFAEFSGIAISSATDGCVGANVASTTTPSAGSFATGTANELLLGMLSSGSSGVKTATNSYTVLDVNTARLGSEYRIVSSTGTYSDGWSFASAAATAALLVSFKSAPTSGPKHKVISQ